MEWILIIILSIVVNAAGLIAAGHYIPGFNLTGGLQDILLVAAILTLLNMTLKPIFRLFLGPIIILTR